MRTRQKTYRSRRKMGSVSKRRTTKRSRRMTPRKKRSRRRSLVGGAEPEPKQGPKQEQEPEPEQEQEQEQEPEQGPEKEQVPTNESATSLLGDYKPPISGEDYVKEGGQEAAAAYEKYLKAKEALDTAVKKPINLSESLRDAFVATNCAVCNSPGDINQIVIPGKVNMHINGLVDAKLIINRCVREHDNTMHTIKDRDLHVTYMVCIKDMNDNVINACQEVRAGHVRCEKRSWYKMNSSYTNPIPLEAFLCGTDYFPNADITLTKNDATKLSINITIEPMYRLKIFTKIYFTPDTEKLRQIYDAQFIRARVFALPHPPDVDLCRLVCGDLIVALETVDQVLKTQNRKNLSRDFHDARWLARRKQTIFEQRQACAKTGHKYIYYEKISTPSSQSQVNVGYYLGPMGRHTMYEDEFTPANYSHCVSCDCGFRVLYAKSTRNPEEALQKFNDALIEEHRKIRIHDVLVNLTMAKVGIEMNIDVDSLAGVHSHLKALSLQIAREMPVRTTPEFKAWASFQQYPVSRLQPQPLPFKVNPAYVLLESCLSDIIYQTRLNRPSEPGNYVKKHVRIGSEDFDEVIKCITVIHSKSMGDIDINKGISIFMATLKSVRELFEVLNNLCNKHGIYKSLGLDIPPITMDTIRKYFNTLENVTDICQMLESVFGESPELKCLEMMINLHKSEAEAEAVDTPKGTVIHGEGASLRIPAISETAAVSRERVLCAVVLNCGLESLDRMLQDVLYEDVVKCDMLISQIEELDARMEKLSGSEDHSSEKQKILKSKRELNVKIQRYHNSKVIITQRDIICELCELRRGEYISVEGLYAIMCGDQAPVPAEVREEGVQAPAEQMAQAEQVAISVPEDGDVAMPI